MVFFKNNDEYLKIIGTYRVNELCDNKYYVYYIKLNNINNIYFGIILNNINKNNKYKKDIYTNILNKSQYNKDKKMFKKRDIKEINKNIKLYNILFNIDDYKITEYNLNITFINYFMTLLIIEIFTSNNGSNINNYNKILNIIKNKLKIYIYDIINIIDNITHNKNDDIFWELLMNEAEKYKTSNKFIYTSIKNIYIKYNVNKIISIDIIKQKLYDFYNILNNKNTLNNIHNFLFDYKNLDIISNIFYINEIIYINNHILQNDPISNFPKNIDINIRNTKNTDYINKTLENFMKFYICII